MRIAFYAPLKPPDAPTPSGDRRLARLLLAALRHAGHDAEPAARLRAYGVPLPELEPAAQAETERLLEGWRDGAAPDLWFTYHLYHKAPDLIGPPVAHALGIPYVIAEASLADKHAGGPWAAGHAACVAAVWAADALVVLNPRDRPALERAASPGCTIVDLPPFLDTGPYSQRPARPANDPPRLLAVGMMRPGDKLASYRALAASLARLTDRPWRLDIVGDGAARQEVEAAFERFGARVAFLGALPEKDLPALYGAADLLVWPAVNEVGSSRVDLQACKLEYSIVSPK